MEYGCPNVWKDHRQEAEREENQEPFCFLSAGQVTNPQRREGICSGRSNQLCQLMSVGYSKTPLSRKLGIKEGFVVAVLNAPSDYRNRLGELPGNVSVETRLVGRPDLIHLFTKSKLQLESEFPRLKGALPEKGAIWISWPKGSSGLETNLNDEAVRRVGLDNGLVDVKIAAFDEVWSALKFVFRAKDRRK